MSIGKAVNVVRGREAIVDAIRTIRCSAAQTEAQLHEQVLSVLVQAGFEPVHEAQLAPGCRIDVLCGSVGIEIKKSRPAPAVLLRQLTRYAACPQVEELIVIAPRGVNLPKRIGGKLVTMVALERLWGISLP